MKKVIRIFQKISIKELIFQGLELRKNILLSLLICLVALVTMLSSGLLSGVSYSNLTRDFQTLTEVPLLTSMMSNVIIWLWISSAVICFYALFIIKKHKSNKKRRKFLLFSGAFILFLAFDDAFQIHELVMPKYFHIPEKIVLVSYILLFASFIYSFAEEILSTQYVYFFLFCVSFCMYYVVEIFFENAKFIPARGFVEESFKFIGVVMWLIYNARLGKQSITESFVK